MSEKCNKLHQWFNGLGKFKFPFNDEEMPLNGIYILFERGEFAHSTSRIVRIGTHTGKDQLRSRLKQHFTKENKNRSIFRMNVGRCFLNKEKDPYLTIWTHNLISRESREKFRGSVDLDKEKEIEKRVTKCIQDNFSFVVFQVDNAEKRDEFESKLISTISLCQECRPSKNWLGLFSPKEKICESGLWLVQELYKEPLSDKDMKELRKTIYS